MNRKHYLDAAFAGLFLDEITDEHMVRWFSDLNDRTSYGAANRTFSTLNHIFNKAEEWGYRPPNTNPAAPSDAGAIDAAIATCRWKKWVGSGWCLTRPGQGTILSAAASGGGPSISRRALH